MGQCRVPKSPTCCVAIAFFDEINAVIQEEPADSGDPEILGQLAAIGILNGVPLTVDAAKRGCASSVRRECRQRYRSGHLVSAPRSGILLLPRRIGLVHPVRRGQS
jgi:hypothetical protein